MASSGRCHQVCEERASPFVSEVTFGPTQSAQNPSTEQFASGHNSLLLDFSTLECHGPALAGDIFKGDR